ncbi:head-tail connector protein [Sphingomonas sp. XXL09]|uniref:head-tail connector protein n=1 Tax=Sphingomonas sp. XXL09 TaxID=3457787 RepID=UPI00406BA2B3
MADAPVIDGVVLTIAAARQHLRVSSSVTDAMLAPLIMAAEDRIVSFLGRPLIGADGWATPADVPPLVTHCAKLALSDFYVNREAPQLTDDQLRAMIGRHQRLSVA